MAFFCARAAPGFSTFTSDGAADGQALCTLVLVGCSVASQAFLLIITVMCDCRLSGGIYFCLCLDY